jgi:gliding motility-associated protein GldC
MSQPKKANIEIAVEFNKDKLPARIVWNATDQPDAEQFKDSKAMLLFLFDREHRETMKIDLWTHDFEIMEMDRMMFHTLRSLADTYVRATSNKELGNQMQQFATYFGEKTGIIPPAS